MPYDILQGVKYDPRYDDQNFALIAQGLDEANKRYDIAEASISDALAQYGAIPAVKEDRPFLTKRLDQFSQDINEMVNKKYAGDYGAASKEIARRIKQEHPYFAAAKQTEEAYRQALPLYQKLQAEGKLVTRGGVNPLAKSTFDEQGNIVGTPTYEMYERGPYEDWIAKNYSQAFQNEVTENAPKFTGQSPYAVAQKLRGLSDETIAKRIGDNDAKKFLEDNKVFAIEYNLDPNKAEDLKVAKDYLVKTAQSQVATQIDNQYLLDKKWELQQEADEWNRRKSLERPSSEDMPIALVDYFTGSSKFEIPFKTSDDLYKDTDPESISYYLKEQILNKHLTEDIIKSNGLAEYIQKDKDGKFDRNATFNKIKDIYTGNTSLTIGPLGVDPEKALQAKKAYILSQKWEGDEYKGGVLVKPSVQKAKDIATIDKYLKDFNKIKNLNKTLNTNIDTELKERNSDLGIRAKGLDPYDERSVKRYEQISDYINTIANNDFIIESGDKDLEGKSLFDLTENKKYKELFPNKLEIKALANVKGNIKYFTKDKNGRVFIVKAKSPEANHEILRGFGDQNMMLDYNYTSRNYNLVPGEFLQSPDGTPKINKGSDYYYKADKKIKLPEGINIVKYGNTNVILDNNNNALVNTSTGKPIGANGDWEIYSYLDNITKQ